MISKELQSRTHLRRLSMAIRVTDTVIVALAVVTAHILRFGTDPENVQGFSVDLSYTLFGMLVAGGWILSLTGIQAYDISILREGSEEYSRVVNSTLFVFGVLAIASIVLRLEPARGYLAIALPGGLLALLLSRWLWRKYVARFKSSEFMQRVVVIGGSTLDELVDTIEARRSQSWTIVGICRTAGSSRSSRQDPAGRGSVRCVDSWREVRQLVLDTGADTVAVSGNSGIGLHGMRELAWDLDGLDIDLLLAPGVLDVSGPRMHLRPVSGLPLILVEKPRYEGARRIGKALVDRVGALILLVLVSPVMFACAVAIKLDSAGPVFYKAERLGLENRPFMMVKFRSMRPDSDVMKQSLEDANEVAGGVLFKMRSDPRVTRVGRFLRRYSLDELPQLFNVIGGSMSLVGPRPPLRSEVERYSGLADRRMLVKPGMTGLWQVSGRSDLSWEESIRLDLTYVENWSATQDAIILWRTVRAVLFGKGAY